MSGKGDYYNTKHVKVIDVNKDVKKLSNIQFETDPRTLCITVV